MTYRKLARHLLVVISLLFLLSGALSPGPEIQNLSLTATSPGNLTTDDLICSYNLAGTATTATTAWYKDGSPIMALLMPFEGGAASALSDHSGNGQTAAANGNPVWNATGGNNSSGAFEFDGVNDYLVVPDAAVLDVDYVTLAAWVYIDSFPNDPRIISKEYGTAEPYSIYTLMFNGESEDKLELRIGVGGTRYRLIGSTAIPGGQWVHIAGTYDGNNMMIYINGLVDATLPLGGVLMKNNNDVWIGASEFYGRYFNGTIDDARIYDHALSPEQILALHSAGPNIIKYTETDIGDIWQTQVIPFSSTEVGSTYVSNTIAIEVDSVPPVIISTPVTDAYAGWLYAYDVDATGYPTPTYTLLTYPTGMTIDSVSGLIEWTPTAAGSEQVIVQADNTEGSDQQNFTITVQESLAVVRISPLGNSITYDNHSGDIRPPEERISYRYPLWQLLTNAGYDFDFVGTLSAGGTYFPDPENDGRPGWTDDQIADSVYTFLQRNPADIVLLHIGTNGVNSSPNDVEDILNEIDRFELDYNTPIWVILAKIINRNIYDTTTASFNTNIETMALARTSDQIVIVDMENGAGIDYRLQPLGDMWDNLHPNDAGYAKMANVWFAALQNMLPVPSPPVCPQEMTHYWKMDEASGSPYKDVHGTNDAQATNEPNLASGAVAGAQEFDGIGDEVTVSDDGTFDWGSGDSFTIEFWMKKDAPCSGSAISDNDVIVGRDDASNNLHWWVGITCAHTQPGVACFQLRDENGNGDAVFGSTVITGGAWHHIVAARDGGADMNRLYVDGVKEDSLSFDYTTGFGGIVGLDIGYLSLPDYYHYEGVVDEIATYDRALSHDEVLAHYLGGLLGEGYCADVEVISAPTILSTPNTEATVLQSYTYDVNASGYPLPTYNLLSFPAGMTINSLTGLIEWVPAVAGSAQVTVEATNSEGSDDQSFTIYVTEPPVCPSGMVSYWKLDETSGTSYDDYYDGNDGNGSVSAPTPSGDGIVGGSQDFNGSSNRITVPDVPAFDWSSNSSFTIEVWAKFTNASGRNKVMIGRDQGGGRPHWWLGAWESTGVATFYLQDTNANGVSLSGPTAINNNQWHHLVVVRDDSVNRNRLYVDGSKVDSATHDYTAGFEAATTLGIGYMAYNGNPDYFYDGLLDEIAVYDRTLSDAEILSHYTNGLSGDGYCSEDSIAPTIVSAPVTDARVNELYTYDVNASGLPVPTYDITVFPAGMTIDVLSGVIEWTPIAAESAQVTVEATNSEGSAAQSFTIVVEEPLTCPPSMTHYWMFEETSGPPYEDHYAGSDATCTNCPTAATGIIGGAQQFNGIDDEVNVTDDNTWDWGKDDSFSIAYWMKTSASTSGNRVIVARDDLVNSLHWWVGCDDSGKERFQLIDVNGNGAYIGNKGYVLNDGGWHFVVAVRDNSADMNRIYVDGVKVDSAYHNYTAGFGSNVPLNIGYINLAHHYRYEGIVDEPATFDKALTAGEVLSYYNDGLSGDGYCTVDSIAPAITSAPVTGATVGQIYTYDVEATGYPAPTYDLTVFPTGMTIGPTDGVIQWTPASAGSVQVTVEASNAKGTDNQNFTIVVEAAPVCPPGMISYWKLNETSGAAYDDFYNGNGGTGSAPVPTPSSGLIGGAQDFNGTNNYITVDDDPSLDWASDSSFTIEVWAKFTNVNTWNKVMIGRDDGGSGGQPHWWLGAQQLTGYALFYLLDTTGAGDFVVDSKAINDNQWHQLVAVRDENVDMNRLYVDGVKVDSAFFNYTAGFEATTTLGIGYMAYNSNPNYFYDGLLDEIALYERALSDGEIQAHYAGGLAGQGYCEQYVLTANTSGSGSVSRSPDKSSYSYGDSVIVTAMPDEGWLFDNWSGGLTGSENPDTIVMLSDTTVTCTFSEDPTGIGDTPSIRVLTLQQNMPNPFNQGTFFDYGLPRSTDVTFGVYDIAGRRVFEKRLSDVPAGWHRFFFDGKDLNGRSLATGVYFYRLKTPREARAGKMVIIR